MNFMDELDAITGIQSQGAPTGYKMEPVRGPEPTWMNELDAIAGTPQQPQSKPEFSTARFIGEQLAKGAINLSDLLPFVSLMNAEIPNPSGGEASRVYPSMTEDILPAVGVDINSQKEDTGLKRIAGHGLRALPGAILGGPTGLARNAAMAGISGAGSGTLQEAGVPAPVADIASIGATALAPMAWSKVFPKGLTGAQRQISKFFKNNIPEAERRAALEALENAKPYPVTEFESSTAGETASPSLSHLHRLQYDAADPQLRVHSEAGSKKLNQAFDKEMGDLSHVEHGEKVKEGLVGKLKQFFKAKKEATNPQYEAFKQDERIREIEPLQEVFKKNRNVSGDLKKDLEYIKDATKPVEGYKKFKMEKHLWERNATEARGAGMKVYREWLKDNPKPKQTRTVGKLTEAEKAMTARIEKYQYKQPSRVPLYKEAKEALGEILADIPEYGRLKQTYAEHMVPIENLKNPSLQKIFAKEGKHYLLDENQVLDVIFDRRATQNIASLEKALGADSPVMNDIRQAAINHYYESITNSGAAGGSRVLSYDKMRKFNNKHSKALDRLLSPEQKKFMDETTRAINSQNIENSQSGSKNSATAGRFGTTKALEQEFQFINEPWYSLNPKAQIAKWGRNMPFIRDWLARRPEKLKAALSNALVDKDVAKKIFQSQFNNQADFNQFMNDVTRMGVVQATSKTDKEEEND